MVPFSHITPQLCHLKKQQMKLSHKKAVKYQTYHDVFYSSSQVDSGPHQLLHPKHNLLLK